MNQASAPSIRLLSVEREEEEDDDDDDEKLAKNSRRPNSHETIFTAIYFISSVFFLFFSTKSTKQIDQVAVKFA